MSSCETELLALSKSFVEKKRGVPLSHAELATIQQKLKSWVADWDLGCPDCPLDQQWPTFTKEEKIATMERFCFSYLNPRA
ncbi:MAG: hypothetical protein Q7S52_01980 [bacterium]|nr:hypothetical protein [bacterium]